MIIYTVFRLFFINTETGFLECSLPIKVGFYLSMTLVMLITLFRVYRSDMPEDPISGGNIISQLSVISVGVMAIVMSAVMLVGMVGVFKDNSIPIGGKISHIIGLPISVVGGLALLYSGYDLTTLSNRLKKAGYALLGAAMQTYMLLYRFPDLSEVATAPPQTLELFYLVSASMFVLFWARTLSGEANEKQNKRTYLTGAAASITGFSFIVGDLVAKFFLTGAMPVREVPLFQLLLTASVSFMALSFVMHKPKEAPRTEIGAEPVLGDI